MCPAIDLEMTGLLTHTICSANEEREKERNSEWDILPVSFCAAFESDTSNEKKGQKKKKKKGQTVASVCLSVCVSCF